MIDIDSHLRILFFKLVIYVNVFRLAGRDLHRSILVELRACVSFQKLHLRGSVTGE